MLLQGGIFINHLTTTYKLLSDETRLRMLVLLYQDNLCVCQLAGILNVPQPRVSKNLARFKDLNLVADERMDKFIVYSYLPTNALLTENITRLLSRIQDFPSLLKDRDGLAQKERYINGTLSMDQ